MYFFFTKLPRQAIHDRNISIEISILDKAKTTRTQSKFITNLSIDQIQSELKFISVFDFEILLCDPQNKIKPTKRWLAGLLK